MMARVQPAVYCLDSAEWMDGYSVGSVVGTYFFKPRRLANESLETEQRKDEMLCIHRIVATDHVRVPRELSNEAGNDEDAGRHHVPLVGSVPARLVLDREEGIQLDVTRTKQRDEEEDEEDVRHHVLLNEADNNDDEQKQLREVVVQEEANERPTVHLVVQVLRLLLGVLRFRVLLRTLLLGMKRPSQHDV